MKIYKVVIEIGFDLSVPESKIKESIIQAVYEDIPEVKLFRLDEFNRSIPLQVSIDWPLMRPKDLILTTRI